jgi:hypothetical protein
MPSGIQTPQIEQPVYQPAQMAVPPQPQGQPSQVLPAQAGYVSKAGAGAFVANNILQGYLKGREVKQQRELAKAQNQMQGADYAYQTLAQNYNDMLRNGKQENDPEVQKAKQAASSAWQAKLQIMGQYATPTEDKKKGAKQKVEGAFSNIFGKAGVTPQMIPQAALQVLQNSPPPGLGLTPQDRASMASAKASEAQAQLAGIETKGAEANLPVVQAEAKQKEQAIADDMKFTVLEQKDPNTRTPEENSWLAMQQRVTDAKTKLSDPKKALLDQVSRNLLDGKPLTEEQRDLAYASGLLQGPHSQITNKGLDQYVTTMSPDGKILSQVKVGREFHEDQAASFQRMETIKKNMEYDGWARALGVPVTKDRDNQRVWQMVQVDMARKPEEMARLTDNPIQQEADMYTLTKALRSLQSESSGPNVSPEQKKATLSKWSNFYTPPNENDKNGMFILRNPAALKDGKFAGGMDATALSKEHEAFINRLRAKIGEQNKNWGSAEIEDFLRRTTPAQAGQPGQLTPPPSAGWFHKQSDSDAQMQPPPQGDVFGENKPGTKLYTVQTDQGPKQAYLTPELLVQVQQSGATVTPAQ